MVSVVLRFEIAIAKLKKYNSSVSEQTVAELIQAGGEYYFLQSINSLILFEIRKNCLNSGRSLLLYQLTKRAIKMTIIIVMEYNCYQLYIKFYRVPFSQGYVRT
jgi:hypothetical protein